MFRKWGVTLRFVNWLRKMIEDKRYLPAKKELVRNYSCSWLHFRMACKKFNVNKTSFYDWLTFPVLPWNPLQANSWSIRKLIWPDKNAGHQWSKELWLCNKTTSFMLHFWKLILFCHRHNRIVIMSIKELKIRFGRSPKSLSKDIAKKFMLQL